MPTNETAGQRQASHEALRQSFLAGWAKPSGGVGRFDAYHSYQGKRKENPYLPKRSVRQLRADWETLRLDPDALDIRQRNIAAKRAIGIPHRLRVRGAQARYSGNEADLEAVKEEASDYGSA